MNKPTAAPPGIRIGIVEDDRLTRMLLVEMINRQESLELVGHWGSAEELMEQIDTARPELLLVDIELPKMNGIELVRRVKQTMPEVSCVMLTSSSDPQNVFESLRQGASGYLIKETSPRELVEGIRAVAEEGVILSPKIARFLVNEFVDLPKASSDVAPGPDVLTSREFEILQLLAADLSPKQCAIKLDLSYETIRTHLKRIYQKLHVKSREEATERFRLHEDKPLKS